jgi:basic amino acid/polyamine antiporter, APA family
MDATAGSRRAGRAEGEGRAEEADRGGLRRAIGGKLLFFFILGDMLGGGIYALVGEVGLETGGAIWTAFLAAFILAALTASSYAELVTKYPRAAGAALYIHRAFRNNFFTFMVAFAVMCSGIASAGALAKGFASDYFYQFLDAPDLAVALVFIGVITAINLVGIKESVRFNLFCTLIEVGGLALILIIGAVTLANGDGDAGRAFEFKAGTAPLFAIVAGATLAFYALIGFEDSVNVAEEVKEPSRTYPPALLGALATAGVVYLLVTLVAPMVVNLGQLTGSDAPLLEVVKEGTISVPEKLFSAIALFALTNGALLNLIMASRLIYGMSEQGVVPRVFRSLLPGRRTPWVAIAFVTALAVVLVVTGDLGILADTTVLLLLFVFTTVNISVLVLRRDRVEHKHYRTPTPLPVLGAVVCLTLAIQSLIDNGGPVYWRAGILLAVGLVLWGINRVVGGRPGNLKAEELAG